MQRFQISLILIVGGSANYAYARKKRAGKKIMSINPNPQNASLFRLEKVSFFIVFVIAAAVLVTAVGIVVDQTMTPANVLLY